ncbi:glycoside hydrolase family 6 protein [Actinomycetospora termitidis]|uniref:Glucanase n=1 Tax=Actinomycetospora termitidis TaxID=3053470 RepID=A0ABT7MG98_9PSEU|nr:glycoside hydrolase family 6 protein [Actinomycetospora sp. Odt1-22]MDL5159680.1 glycoside hydrolase family 6 protein [Actinomycetospora sp. Odt1-22]
MRTRRRRPALLTIAALVSVAALAGCTTAAEEDGPPSAAPAASSFWVDPDSASARQVQQWRDQGRTRDADDLAALSSQPLPIWVGDWSDPGDLTRDVTTRAGRTGDVPVLVAYNIPNRDCGLFSQGGADDEAEYRRWVDDMASGLEGRPAVVIVEPDALAQTLADCEGQGRQEGREALLAYASQRLAAAGAEVYIDAGNPGFIRDVDQLAAGLRSSGVADAEGFALNVANFNATEDVAAYGRAIADRLPGSRFVIDTGRNGNGTYGGPEQPTWCNPPGRALGSNPTRDTGDPRIAAFLWIKEPGDSDGTCRGNPASGQFMPDYALDLVRNRAAS